MTKSKSTILGSILIVGFLTTCKQHENPTTNNSIIQELKTEYIFKVTESDSLKIQLIVRNDDNSRFVKELRLPSGETLALDSTFTYLLQHFEMQAIDLNFDGNNDLRVLKDKGATGNNWYDTWIYDPKTKKFSKSSFLSQKSGIWVDTLNRRVISKYYGGWADQILEAYTVKDTTYQIVQDWYVEQRNTNSMVYINTVRNNRLVKRDSLFSKKDLTSLYKLKNGYN